MFPKLSIDLQSIHHNTEVACIKCRSFGIDVTAITKCCAGNPDVARAFLSGGAVALGDSRIINLKELKDIHAHKWLIRIPMVSEAEQAILYTDLALVSDLSVMKALNDEAKRLHKRYEVVLMGDIGDLREGWFFEEDFLEDLKEIQKLSYLTVRGVGTNTNCASGMIPEPDSFGKLVEMSDLVKEMFGQEASLFSGGSSGSYYMVENGTIPSFINNLRLGEVLLFGNEASYGQVCENMHTGNFRIHAEVVEIKEKPSVPVGKIGKDAFGKEHTFMDKGIRKRMIAAIGKQDIDIDSLRMRDPGAEIITASSDHMIVDITNSKHPYQVGEIIAFDTNYSGALRANTSQYIETITV